MTRAELIKRLEAATEPSRELDALICRDVTPDLANTLTSAEHSDIAVGWCVGGVPRQVTSARFYTESIDTALALVPRGWAWMVGCAPGEGFFAELQTMSDTRRRHVSVTVTHVVPAVALSIAALKVRDL